MLHELFTYLTTPCPSYVRGMDYLYEVIALRGRYARHQASWRSHLANSQSFVLSCAESCPDHNKAVILGAGLLLDVPLERLAALFQQVVLVDIVFLSEIKRRVRHLDNVSLLAHDVTNIAQSLYRNVKQNNHQLPLSRPSFPDLAKGASLVVSLNLLSQLMVSPHDFAQRRIPDLDNELLESWCLQVVDAHLQALASLNSTVCLITDYESQELDLHGTLLSRESTLFGLTLPPAELSWDWDLAPRGELHRRRARSLIVGGWRFSQECTPLAS